MRIINLPHRVVERDNWIKFVTSLKQSLVQSKCSEGVSHDEDDKDDGDGGGSGSGDNGNYDACLSQSLFFLPLFLLITAPWQWYFKKLF